tara:strand:- start:658 stop:783 length:126 start_codon:yes stop_codon:yes gene_type:complete
MEMLEKLQGMLFGKRMFSLVEVVAVAIAVDLLLPRLMALVG